MIRLLALCAMLAILPSCIAVGGTNSQPRATAGQELIDLKAALDKGAITQAEYDQKEDAVPFDALMPCGVVAA